MLASQMLKDKSIQETLRVAPGTTVGDAANLLSAKKIGGVLVAEEGDGMPLGIVTERDIVRELGKRGAVCLGRQGRRHHDPGSVTCAPNDRAVRVLQVMTEKRFRHMPVMDEDRLVGLVSIGDLVKARLDELGAQAEALKNMIMGY
ncbi:MAG: CBS domain-containing protein [Paracoccaceae bacterium]